MASERTFELPIRTNASAGFNHNPTPMDKMSPPPMTQPKGNEAPGRQGKPRPLPKKTAFVRQRVEDKRQLYQLGDQMDDMEIGSSGLPGGSLAAFPLPTTHPLPAIPPPPFVSPEEKKKQKEEQAASAETAFKKEAEQEWAYVRNARQREAQAAAAARRGVPLSEYLQKKEDRLARRAERRRRFPEKQEKKKAKRQAIRAARRQQQQQQQQEAEHGGFDDGMQDQDDEMEQPETGLAGGGVSLDPLDGIDYGDDWL